MFTHVLKSFPSSFVLNGFVVLVWANEITETNINKSVFLKRMQNLSKQVRSEPKKSKENVMLPNDPEIKKMKLQLKKGIELSEDVYKNLLNLSKKYSIKLNIV